MKEKSIESAAKTKRLEGRSVELIIQKESLQRRDGGNPPSTNQSRGESAVRSERQFFPDQGVIDSYSDLARK
jgi:hypothetical protein